MADAIVDNRPSPRFFCHRCLVEFQDVEQAGQARQDYICPYCEGGFIEQVEGDAGWPNSLTSDDYSDADMSNIDEMGLDDSASTTPSINDLAFLMAGTNSGQPTFVNAQVNALNGTSTPATDSTNPERGPTLMEELLWMITGGRPPAGAMTAGTPFVMVGAPGDYVFGGEGLDSVVTQLLGQLEQMGPAPLPRERLAALPSERVSADLAAGNIACSVCWEDFKLEETITRLECEHIFHQGCITPWLELHATCPICRRSLLPDPAPAPAPTTTTAAVTSAAVTASTTTPSTTSTTGTTPSAPSTTAPHQFRFRTPLSSLFVNATPHIVIQRRTGQPTIIRRIPTQTLTWNSMNNTSTSGSMSPASSVTTGGIWANGSTNSTNSTSSLNSNDRDRQYNTDMDCD